MSAASENTYFYYGTTKKLVAVFGALFNDIYTGRKLSDGTLANVIRVPLSYGPREKFLQRITEEKKLGNEGQIQLQIKLPRMAFEITGISYDSAAKLNSMNRRTYSVDGNDDLRDSAYLAVPYIITFQLNIFSRVQDDALQILEQILPIFKPDYTVSIKDLEGPNTTTDIPFVLNDITFTDDYEGDMLPNRPIIYTLTFSAKVRYLGSIKRSGIIKRAMVNFRNPETLGFFGEKVVAIEDPYSTDDIRARTFISDINPDDEYAIEVSDVGPTFTTGENLIGVTSGYAGVLKRVEGNTFIVHRLENMYDIGEDLIGDKSNTRSTIVSVTKL